MQILCFVIGPSRQSELSVLYYLKTPLDSKVKEQFKLLAICVLLGETMGTRYGRLGPRRG